MLGIYNSITINGNTIYQGNDFTLSREYLYAGEIETCIGKRCADLVGWRYEDVTIEWDALPDSQLQDILSLTGAEVNFTFGDAEGNTVTEAVIPVVIATTATRFTDPQGNSIWKDVGLKLQFINAHN